MATEHSAATSSAFITSENLIHTANGAMQAAISAFDWSVTPLGDASQWPARLNVAVDMMLHTPAAMLLIWGPAGTLLYNDAFSTVAEDRHPQILGLSVFDAWPELREFNEQIAQHVFAGHTLSFRDKELKVYRRGRLQSVWFNLDYSPLYGDGGDGGDDGAVQGIMAVVLETTNSMLLRETLRSDQQRLAKLFENAPGLVAMARGPELVFEFANASYMELVGQRELIGKTVREALPELENQGIFDLLDNVYQSAQPYIGRAVPMTLQRHADGTLEERFIDFVYEPLKDNDGNVIGIFAEGHDVTEYVMARQALERQSRLLSHQATHDRLTNLPNRQVFESRLSMVISESVSTGSTHVALYLDLDNFRVINEMSSYAVGDQMLISAADAIRSCQAPIDTVSRLGGDTFGVLVTNATVSDGVALARYLLSAIAEIRLVGETRPVRLKASIGLVPVTGDSAASSVIKTADSACETAKRCGGGRLHIHQSGDFNSQRRQADIELYSQILAGLEQNSFFLMHQMISSLGDTQTCGNHFELLIRLRDPDSGQVLSPGEFIPAAERLRLSPRLDQWVIDNAFSTLSSNPAYATKPYLCAINLSAISINQSDFADYILEKLDEYNIPPGQICLEITETAVIEHMATASEFINKVRGAGCLFALDDFGSGLSSYGYLRTLPVDFVKIDGSFVRNMHENAVDYAIVKSIHELATLMGKRTIAEFVENEQIVEQLKRLGVDFAQGYGLHRPEPFEIYKGDGG